MTTNNEVKASRPCTLWGQTFDSNLFRRISVMQVNDITSAQIWLYVPVEGELKYIKSPTSTDGVLTQKYYNEAIQAIASAQRPWLKAEGFQFVDGQWYNIMQYGNIVYPYKYDATENSFTNSDLSAKDWNDPYLIKRRDVLAFKPISDTQEAWDAVAGVEVYKGVV